MNESLAITLEKIFEACMEQELIKISSIELEVSPQCLMTSKRLKAYLLDSIPELVGIDTEVHVIMNESLYKNDPLIKALNGVHRN